MFHLCTIHAPRGPAQGAGGTRRRPFIHPALLPLLLVLLVRGTAAAADFGLVLSPTAEYVADAGGKGFGFTGSLSPWVSAALGEKMNLYFSGKVAFEYAYEKGAWAWPPLVELERTELHIRPHQRVNITLGRQRYRDSGELIASGLFDGLSGSIGLGRTRLSLGAYYTGFQYKETAEILMTAEDRDAYLKPLDYGNPDTYFASRRVLLPLDLEFSDLTPRLSLAFTLLAQFDVNDAPALHTQYLETRFGVEAADTLRFSLTGIVALEEYEDTDTRGHFAAAFTADWDVPGALTDMLSAGLRWGSGAISDALIPYAPVSSLAQGMVFTPALPGLMNARAAYTARPHRTLSVSGETVLFWRTDEETVRDKELDSASKGRFLGTELYGSLVWAFQSALRLSAGGGVFFPGGAFVEGAAARWKINTGIMLSL